MLLDLGGVLVQFDGLEQLRALLPDEPSLEEATRGWLLSRAVRSFERGEHRDAQRFARETVRELDLSIDAGDFLDRFLEWVPRPLPGARDLLRELRQQLSDSTLLACLSNTNPLHAERFHRWFPDCFDRLFFSFETGYAKPDADAFVATTAALGLTPQDIWFGDDSQLNVLAAQALGWRAERVRGPLEVRHSLVRLGLLPGDGASRDFE